MSSSGATSLPRRDGASSPAMSDTSDSDISLGTHSPVPSSASLQHSPGSTSGGGNDRDDRLNDDRDKDYRNFSALNSFRFDVDSPGNNISGENHLLSQIYKGKPTLLNAVNPFVGPFGGRFMPTLPYRLGENSPPISAHSPLVGLNISVPLHVLRPQPQLPTNFSTNGSNDGQTLLPSPTQLSPLRIRVSSPNRLNSDIVSTHGLSSQGIVRIVPPNGPPMLHRPFSPSPQPKDIVS